MSSADDARGLLAAVVGSHPTSEDRPQQRQMAELVAQTVESGDPLIVQAGTGTGKSLAYLCGGVGAAATMVVSTATKQLSDQLLADDIPLVADIAPDHLGHPLRAVALKGRANYLCLAKVSELRALDEQAPPPSSLDLDLGDWRPVSAKKPTRADLTSLNELLEWADTKPSNGDRNEAPAVPDRIWSQVSTDSASCPGARACQFGDDCLAEAARAAAREADVVIVNHALLAQDLISPNPMFDDRDLIVIDEIQELQGYLSSAWGHEISASVLERVITTAIRKIPSEHGANSSIGLASTADTARAALADSRAVISALNDLPGQLWTADLPPEIDGPLQLLARRCNELGSVLDTVAKQAPEGEAPKVQTSRTELLELAVSIEAVRAKDDLVVRWSERGLDGNPGVLRAAPLEVGAKFRQRIGKRALVATSATASIAGDFEPIARILGLNAPEVSWSGVDVGSPFDYQKQAILYVPTHLPEPVGKDRTEHTLAVLDELTELVEAAGGRTLALFTTGAAARNAADFLRQRVSYTILTTGELPAAVLAEEFAEDETSVLCATLGMWSGLNVVGPACSLVVIDKIPFAPMNDPLASARRTNADAAGRNGFGEVFVNNAALKLTQGVGRLIRSRNDRGVVAILDPRLHSKGYGAVMLRSLPPMWRTTDPKMVRESLARLTCQAE